jgi:glyceraldehyde 3-phosphate dehydrogenase
MNTVVESTLAAWQTQEAFAEAMIPLIGALYRDRNVVTNLYGRALVNQSVMSIIKQHRFVKQMANEPLMPEHTLPFLKALIELDLAPCRVDVAKLAHAYVLQAGLTQMSEVSLNQAAIAQFVKTRLEADLQKQPPVVATPQDVVLYGFGRIGRLVARILIEKAGGGHALRLKAVVVRNKGADDLQRRASLLRRDSVHGAFNGTIRVDEANSSIIANGNMIRFIYADDPSQIDYTAYGISDALLVDNTGKWRDEAGLSKHLASNGIAKVLLTAPGKGDLKNIVFGVNDSDVLADDRIVSAASCTTNAIVPILKAVNDTVGVEHGHVETVHAYTNDQNLIDNFHKGHRRGRSAAMNMVITETGAAKAVVKALPEFAGKLTGNAIRVPIPDVSLAILNLTLSQNQTREALNELLRKAALFSPMRKQIDFSNSPEVVSSDFIGSRFACVVDAQSTIVNQNRCVLYIWYDNEFGYSCQVVRLLQKMAGLSYPVVPLDTDAAHWYAH